MMQASVQDQDGCSGMVGAQFIAPRSLERLWERRDDLLMKATVDWIYTIYPRAPGRAVTGRPEEMMPELMMEIEEGAEIVELLIGAEVMGFLFQRFFRPRR
jgi:hypothetical protein